MNREALLELIEGGENPGVEFMRDDIGDAELAAVLAAFANSRGGELLLGVDEDGSVPGIRRKASEAVQRVTDVCRDRIRPPLAPYLDLIEGLEGSKTVVGLSVPAGEGVHAVRRGRKLIHVVRDGSRNREASREELAGLLRERKAVCSDGQPVPGAALGDLDRRRLRHYLCGMRGLDEPGTEGAWVSLLNNADIMDGETVTSGGMLLFGNDPCDFLPQSEVVATAYQGTDKESERRDSAALNGAMVPHYSGGKLQEEGLVEQALGFLRRNTSSPAETVDGRKTVTPEYPERVLREALVNAMVHRDYFLVNSNIELNVYNDRIEIVTPGELPDGITIAKMRNGARDARNPMMYTVMWDYGYIERQGRGLPKIIVKGMVEHNGTEPELVAQDERFILRLFSGS